jgi:transposase
VENLRLEINAASIYHGISGVTALDDLRRGGWQALSLDVRYRLLDREQTSFGLLEHLSLGLNRWDSQGFVNERVWRHDSILRGQSMPRPYSNDLRARVIEAIEAGASRREVADRYELSPSVVVIWAQRWEETGSVAAKPSGGSTSPLEEHAEFLLRLIVEQPDSTLDEIVAAMRKKRIPGSRSAVWRFFERRNISFKKNFVRDGAKTRGNRPRAPALDAAARHV